MYPRLYIAGQKNKRFNPLIFILSLIKGIAVAIIVFFVLYGLTFLNVYKEGYEWDFQSFGYAASGALVIIVNLQVILSKFSIYFVYVRIYVSMYVTCVPFITLGWL